MLGALCPLATYCPFENELCFNILFINQISTFMKKNLFLAGALALFAAVGVSAQSDWCRTLATGLPGQEITHDVNGTSVTQYRAETALIKNAGATGVRYTVVQTTATGAYGGGPFFAMGEMIVLDAQGDTIGYTVTSNADHNSGGAGTDGAGLPALNDGNFNNFFHSSWGGTEPGGLHYLELTFEKSLDEFQLVWYTRPNQHVNRPTVVGLTNPGVAFTEDMLFAEYGFELGEQVTTLAELQKGGAFTLYVEGPKTAPSDETITGPGNVYVALSGYTTGSNEEAAPQNIVQFIPAAEAGKFILYQPIYATYYCDPNRWTDGYNGKNGWLRAYSEAQYLDEFTFTEKGNGEFEITTEIYREYADGEWTDIDPITVWVGYDMRGNLKIFPQNVKEGLEQGDYTLGFGLPVDFGFKINKATVNEELVPAKTAAEMCDEVLSPFIKLANEMKEKYAEYSDEETTAAYEEAIAAAEAAIAKADLAGAFEALPALKVAIAEYVGLKLDYYYGMYDELTVLYEDNKATPPYNPSDEGKYTKATEELLAQINDKLGEGDVAVEDGAYTTLEDLYAQLDALIEQFEGTALHFSTFPEVVSDIPATLSADYPNNAVWKKEVAIAGEKVKGIRLTFLDRHIGTAGDAGNFPMIALGEFRLYDQDGVEIELAESNFEANYTETQEGFESTVARLCDGKWGEGDKVGTEGSATQSYYHSPWSGNEPQEYICIDVTFPEAMNTFSFEVYSRDKTTSNGAVSLFPKKVAITEVGVAYDPLLFTENPYNVFVDEKVTSVAQIEDGGLYVIKGLLNTQKVWKEVSETVGEGTEAVTTTAIKEVEPEGTAMFYHGTDRFHSAAAAVRAPGVYRFVKNDDGTYKVLSLGLAKYWPSTTETGFVGDGTTYEAEKAANLNIVASTNIADAFVMYEKIEGLTTQADSIDTDEDGIVDAEGTLYQTPYVMFMDWASSLATRPVVDPQPVKTSAELADNWGDAQCFTKQNGEAEWEIYKVTIENPDFYWLTNLTAAFDKLGLIVGTDPGCVSNLGALESVLAEGQRVVNDSVFADAPAAAAALAKEIAAVNNLEKNPMVEGIYQVVSANADFKAKQNKEKALYATVDADGVQQFGWKDLENNDIQFYFNFTKSPYAEEFVAGEVITEEEGDKLYNILAVATYEGATPYYIGEVETQSSPIDLFAIEGSNYLVLNANGSAFSFRLAGKGAGFSIHANQHGGGTGQSGNIVYWDGGAGASQWYLRKVDYETSIDDFVAEGTEVVAVSYFTPAGAAVPAPVKGVNVVVTVYANGVVETKKVLVK